MCGRFVVFGGPIESNDPDDVALMAMDAADHAEVLRVFADDPWVISGVLEVKESRDWKIWLRPPRA